MGVSADRAEATIEFVGRDGVTELQQRIVGGMRRIGEAGDDAADTTRRIGEAAEEGGKSWDRIVVGWNAALEIGGKILEVVGTIGDWMQAAAEEQALGRQFEAAYEHARDLGEALSEAVGGRVEGGPLQKLALQAKGAGIAIEQLPQLLELAARASSAGFGPTAKLAEKIVGAASKGASAVDELAGSLGLAVDATALEAEESRRVGRALAEIEKRQIAINELLRVGAAELASVSLDGPIAQAERLKTQWAEFVGELQSATLALGDAGFWRDFESNATAAINPVSGEFVGVAGGIGMVGAGLAAVSGALDESGAHLEAWGRRMRGQFGEVPSLLATTAAAFETLNAALLARQKIDDEIRANEERDRRLDAEAVAAGQAQAAAEEGMAEAVRKHVASLEDYVTAHGGARIAEAARLRSLADLAEEQGRGLLAMQLHIDAEREMEGAIASNAAAIDRQAEEMWISRMAAIALADSYGDVADAIIAWNEAEAAMSGAPGAFGGAPDKGAKPPPRRGGGGGRAGAKGPQPDVDLRQALETLRGVAEDFRELEETARFDAFLESSRLAIDAMEEQIGAVARLREMLRDSARDSLSASGTALRESGDEAGEAIASVNEIMFAEWGRYLAIEEQVRQAGGGPFDTLAAAAPGAVAAIGRIAGALFQWKALEYGILCAGELAESIKEFAAENYLAGALHLAASIQYGVAAAKAGSASVGGGGGGGGRGGASGRPNIPSRLQKQDGGKDKGTTIVVKLEGGTFLTNDHRAMQQFGQQFARSVGRYLPMPAVGFAK